MLGFLEKLCKGAHAPRTLLSVAGFSRLIFLLIDDSEGDAFVLEIDFFDCDLQCLTN